MTKVWHISDVHLSFDENYQTRKPMDQRKWSIGSWTYVGYLDKMKDFSEKNIRDEDIVIITGDITHDMKMEYVAYQLRWLDRNIKGTKIICRGNHDKYWDVGYARRSVNLPTCILLDEYEMVSFGPYVIGCYSDHGTKTDKMGEIQFHYNEMARRIVSQAKAKHKVPVMISHYPVGVEQAEQIGKLGIKAYLSGHVHCTSNEPGSVNGVLWKWYDISAGMTDDKTFSGCFFSTATTDVALAKHGQIFKEIECLRSSSLEKKELNTMKGKAIAAFGCDGNLTTPFEKVDPFNTNNTVAGFICRKKGKMQGSLYITHVNGSKVKPQLIYGTPKLEYPYTDQSDSREYIDFGTDPKYYFMADKWNGTNVSFFKYEDRDGKVYVSAKSKGTPFLSDTEVGNFLTLTRKAMTPELKRVLDALARDRGKQSITFELCGKEEPHLVKYDFDIELKMLFVTFEHGAIRPAVQPHQLVPYKSSQDMQDVCRYYQRHDFISNEMYRKQAGLPHKYEYEHFQTEGRVLYLLDANGFLLNRTMYKVKPKDIEEVHWQSFDKDMKGRVLEAIRKIKASGEKVSFTSLQEELDMGPKEWGKFGKHIMLYAQSGEANKHTRVVLLCGMPGSGKSTVAKIMEHKGWVRVNQDDLGSRNACKKIMEDALSTGRSVVVDRCNFDDRQRKTWIDLAMEFGVSKVECAWFDLGNEECLKRASKRKNHPTIPTPEIAEEVINRMSSDFVAPSKSEGIARIIKITEQKRADVIAEEIING